MSKFDRVHRDASHALSRFVNWLPVLLRALLLLLFTWYAVELLYNATGLGAKAVLVVVEVTVLVTLVVIMHFTRQENPNENEPPVTMRLWPFVLINLLMILLVGVLGKWDRERGAQEVTTGLLGFTSYWAQRIGNLLTGRG